MDLNVYCKGQLNRWPSSLKNKKAIIALDDG
jgi:hypothetical protein